MNYDQMCNALQAKNVIARRHGWNNNFAHVGQVTRWNGNVCPNTQNYRMLPFMYLRDALGNIQPWNPSSHDITADDWMVFHLDASQVPADNIVKTYTLDEALTLVSKVAMNIMQPRVSRLPWNGMRWIRRYAPFSDREFTMREEGFCEGTWMPFLVYKDERNALYPFNAMTQLSDEDRNADDWAIHQPEGL